MALPCSNIPESLLNILSSGGTYTEEFEEFEEFEEIEELVEKKCTSCGAVLTHTTCDHCGSYFGKVKDKKEKVTLPKVDPNKVRNSII